MQTRFKSRTMKTLHALTILSLAPLANHAEGEWWADMEEVFHQD